MLFPETKRVSESSLPDNKHNHINPGSWVQSLPTQFSHSELSSSPSSSTELVIDRNQTAHFYIGDDDARYTPTTVTFAGRSKLPPPTTCLVFSTFNCHSLKYCERGAATPPYTLILLYPHTFMDYGGGGALPLVSGSHTSCTGFRRRGVDEWQKENIQFSQNCW